MNVVGVSISMIYDNGETHTVEFPKVVDFQLAQRRPTGFDEKQVVSLNRTNISVSFSNGDDGFTILPRTQG